jgi:hypothetical protein
MERTESVAEPHRFSGLNLETEERLGIYTRRDEHASICRAYQTPMQSKFSLKEWLVCLSVSEVLLNFSSIYARNLTTHIPEW